MSEVVFGTGRFNPPTRGHNALIKRVRALAAEKNLRAEIHIVDGEQSGQDKAKNPLSAETRQLILRQWYPDVRFEIVASAYDAMEVLEVQGKVPAYMVAGSDRAKKYGRLLDYAGFKTSVIVALDREAGEADGVSATKARAAAAADDFETFASMMPSEVEKNSVREVFDLVRKALTEDGNG